MNNWLNLKLRQAFQNKLPKWFYTVKNYSPPRLDRITFLEKEKCPICHQTSIYCCRNDFGRIDMEPKFAHICANENCEFVVETEIYGVNFPDIEASVNYCPWCLR